MSILKNLYNGYLAPDEDIIPQNADYRPLTKEIGDEREYFLGILSEEDKERFKKWDKKVFRYEEMTEFANFAYGFRLGAMLAFEIFAGTDSE